LGTLCRRYDSASSFRQKHDDSVPRRRRGVTPNIAARLSDLAVDDEILVSPATHRGEATFSTSRTAALCGCKAGNSRSPSSRFSAAVIGTVVPTWLLEQVTGDDADGADRGAGGA
jgi:hypothetical protein